MDSDVAATPEPIAEMDRLGDEIAELAAQLDAATARLLDLIREFDVGSGGRRPRPQARCFLKKAIVRSQASLADASWYRGVELL